MARSVVCISHATGSGGEDVGRLVAERLSYRYVDDEIVARAAAEGALDPAEVADEERRKSLAARLLEAMAQSGEAWALVAGDSTGSVAGLRGDHVRALIRDAISRTAAGGQVVIVAHGASHVVSGLSDVLRVLVTASPETRAVRVAEVHGLDRAQAARKVRESDAARRDYLSRFYEIDEELPTHYDLVVNTDRVSLEEAARLVGEAGSS